mmetsp:Transcript_4186/g.14700  ORF Transcript_4186/g.14700 Transcript_4186/m.14700 type:complete len:242 (+) Transcript_4186:1953-2678(+)
MIWTFGRGADACGRDADDFASRVTSIEASNIARACIFVISGDVMPTRQPRSPSSGFVSRSARVRSSTRASVCPVSAVSSAVAAPNFSASNGGVLSNSPGFGRNSCNGGSNSRTHTGLEPAARNSPAKSALWSGKSAWSAAARVLSSSASTSLRTVSTRSLLPKNICSVRARPTPAAPARNARRASSASSALARTSSSRYASTHRRTVARSPSSSKGGAGSTSGTARLITSPVVPFRDTTSP